MHKILVIDDEEILRERLKKLLMLDDFDVVVAEDGVRGIEVFKAESPQAVILDIKMPRMDGVEVLKHLRDIDESVEVIMVTGHASLETALEALRLGAFDYIGKPVNYDELKLVVDRALENRELRLKLRREQAHREFFEEQMLLQLSTNLNMTKTLLREQLEQRKVQGGCDGLSGLMDRINAMFLLNGLLEPKRDSKEVAMQGYLEAIGREMRQVFGLAEDKITICADDHLLAAYLAVTCGWIVRGLVTFGFNGEAAVPSTLPVKISFAPQTGRCELKVSVTYAEGAAAAPAGGTAMERHINPMVSICLNGKVSAVVADGRCDLLITFPCAAS